MSGLTDDRALWLAEHILPHEAWLRRQLARNPMTGIDIDDVVQEAYARLILLDSVDHIRNPRNYFFQAAKTALLQHVRRSRVVPIDAVADLAELDHVSDEPLPDRVMAARQELRVVAEAIATLPPKCREVYILRKVDGLSQREIAERLGTSQSNVEKHFGRGVKALMDFFGSGGKMRRPASMEMMTDFEDDGRTRDSTGH